MKKGNSRVLDLRTGLYHDQIRTQRGRFVSRELAARIINHASASDLGKYGTRCDSIIPFSEGWIFGYRIIPA